MADRLRKSLDYLPVQLRVAMQDPTRMEVNPGAVTITLWLGSAERVRISWMSAGAKGTRTILLPHGRLDTAAHEAVLAVVASTIQAHLSVREDVPTPVTAAPRSPSGPTAERLASSKPLHIGEARGSPEDLSRSVDRTSLDTLQRHRGPYTLERSAAPHAAAPQRQPHKHDAVAKHPAGNDANPQPRPNEPPVPDAQRTHAPPVADFDRGPVVPGTQNPPPPPADARHFALGTGYESMLWSRGVVVHGPRAWFDYSVRTVAGRWGGRLEGSLWWQTRVGAGAPEVELWTASGRLLATLIPSGLMGKNWHLEFAAGLSGLVINVRPGSLPADVRKRPAQTVLSVASRVQTAAVLQLDRYCVRAGIAAEAGLSNPVLGIVRAGRFVEAYTPFRLRPGIWISAGRSW